MTKEKNRMPKYQCEKCGAEFYNLDMGEDCPKCGGKLKLVSPWTKVEKEKGEWTKVEKEKGEWTKVEKEK